MLTRTNTAASRLAKLLAYAAAGVLVALGVLNPTAAHAETPVDLAGAYVLDNTGVLAAGEAEQIKVALDELYAETGIGLFVVYTDRFDGAASAEEWAYSTSVQSGLGSSDALLAIAADDRAYYMSVADAFPLSDDELAGIEDAFLIPELRNDNWAAAAVAYASGIRTFEPAATGTGGSSSPSYSLPSIDFVPVLIVLGSLGVAVALTITVIVLVRRRRRRAAEALAQKQLDQKAGALLIAVDDALKTSEDEFGFAVAQFGEEATGEFAAALAQAKTSVAEAFTIRQRLDDAFPETAAEKRQLGLRIIELCEDADAVLDAQAEAFDALRELEANAPAILDEVDQQTAALTGRVARTTEFWTRMEARYSADAVAAVADNVDAGTKLLAGTIETASAARARIGSGGSVAVDVRTVQAGAAQVAKLFDAVEQLSVDLVEAQVHLTAAIGELGRDIEETRAVPGEELLVAIDTATSGLQAVLPDADSNPIASLHRIERLDADLSAALGALRARQERERRARVALSRLTSTTSAQIASTEQYIDSHRSKVDSDARTRLSNAASELNSALAHDIDDPEGALAYAERAEQLVAQALKLARNDVAEANRPAPSYSSYGSSSSSFGGSSFGGSSSSSRRGGGSSFSSSPSRSSSGGGGGRRGGGGRF